MTNPTWFVRTTFSCALVFTVGISSTGASDLDRPFSALFVFGDSLSDSGNAYVLLGGETSTAPYEPVPSAPYATRRFTNGRTWVELLADELRLHDGGLPALRSRFFGNYAVGGAEAEGGSSPDFGEQVDLLLHRLRKRAPSDALYVVEFGGNDVRVALAEAQSGGDPATEIEAAVAAIGSNIDTLYNAGARRFLVASVPNLGRAPVVAVLGEAAAREAETLSVAFNTRLNAELASLSRRHGIAIYRVDFFAFLDAATDMPDGLGFTGDKPMNAQPCLPVFDPADRICRDADRRLFWDGLHPTRAAHRIVASIAFNRLSADKHERR